MFAVDEGGWRYFLGEDYSFGDESTGKWMFYYGESGLEHAEEMCAKAVQSGVVRQAKRADISGSYESGVACLYLPADDMNGHRRVIRFLIENDLIRKTKTGRLFNISFKLDSQTLAGEYGSDFVPTLRLSDFVDLETGEFLS